jgi:hypothetical protein
VELLVLYANQLQSSSSGGRTSLLHRLAGDSGFYDDTLIHGSLRRPHHQQKLPPFGSSCGKSISIVQENVSDLLAKWEKWLHDWYINSGRRIPNENQLLSLCASINAPLHAVQARFQHYHELDNYSSDSLLYSTSSSLDVMAPPETSELTIPTFADPPVALLEMQAHLVELTVDDQTSLTYPPGEEESSAHLQRISFPVNAIPRSLRVAADTISGASVPSITQHPRSERVILTESLVSLILRLVRTRQSTGCGSRASG